MKQDVIDHSFRAVCPAAFGRLCVETMSLKKVSDKSLPAAFGRLCVETYRAALTVLYGFQPPSGGCVLKHWTYWVLLKTRLPAAFGRLCVETSLAEDAPNPDIPAAFGRLCVETRPTD